MEPRARAGKNVGKMNFGYGELRQLLYGSGDAREPLPETMRLLDEIATDFIQSLSFEAARVAHYAGRQKIKYEDFEFALRRNPLFLGKVREMFEMSKEVKEARKMPGIGEGNLAKADVNELVKLGEGEGGGGGDRQSSVTAGGGSSGRKRAHKDKDADGSGKKKRKKSKAAGGGGGLFEDDDDDDGLGLGPGDDGASQADGATTTANGGADARGSTAPTSAVGASADDGDDLADLDGDLDVEMR